MLLSVLSAALLAQVIEYRTLGWSWSLRGFERGGQHSAFFWLLSGGRPLAGRGLRPSWAAVRQERALQASLLKIRLRASNAQFSIKRDCPHLRVAFRCKDRLIELAAEVK